MTISLSYLVGQDPDQGRVRLNTRSFQGETTPHRAGDPSSLFSLAPHGVFHTPSLTLGVVGSYPAFSPFPDKPSKPGKLAVYSL